MTAASRRGGLDRIGWVVDEIALGASEACPLQVVPAQIALGRHLRALFRDANVSGRRG